MIFQHYQGFYTEAKELMKRSIEIAEEALGPSSPNLAYVINNLGVLMVMQVNLCRKFGLVPMYLWQGKCLVVHKDNITSRRSFDSKESLMVRRKRWVKSSVVLALSKIPSDTRQMSVSDPRP